MWHLEYNNLENISNLMVRTSLPKIKKGLKLNPLSQSRDWLLAYRMHELLISIQGNLN